MILISLTGIVYSHQKEAARIKQYQALSQESKIVDSAETVSTIETINKIDAVIKANVNQRPENSSKENSLVSEKELFLQIEESGNEISKHFSYDWDHLLLSNSDIKGWLTIPDTLIDFPVVGTDDNNYYLTHNFLKKKDKAGCPFFDKSTEIWDHNRVIYGHNMGAGSKSMFSTLLQYEKREYFDSHPVIYLTEIYGTTTAYEIIAVIKLNVMDMESWDFRTREFQTKEIYEAWHKQMQQRALYFKQSASGGHYPAKLLTLSTCDRREWGADGRLIIIGRAI